MILNRYFLKSIFSYTLAISLIFILIIVSSRSIQYLEQAARGEINAEIVFSIILLRLPEFLELILPLGFFLSIILAMGKFRSEGEFIIMEQSGFNPTTVYSLLTIPAALICILLFYFSSILNPNLTSKVNDLLNIKTLEDSYSSLTPGEFHKLGQGIRLYAMSKDQEDLKQVFLSIRDQQTNKDSVLIAKAFKVNDSSSDTLVFQEGLIYQDNKGNNLSSIEFQSFSLNNYLNQKDPYKFMESKDAQKPIFWAISLCIMTAVSVFIAVPLSKISPRKGRYSRVFPGLLVFSIYSGFLLSLKGEESEQIESLIATHFIFLILAMFLNFYSYGRSR